MVDRTAEDAFAAVRNSIFEPSMRYVAAVDSACKYCISCSKKAAELLARRATPDRAAGVRQAIPLMCRHVAETTGEGSRFGFGGAPTDLMADRDRPDRAGVGCDRLTLLARGEGTVLRAL